MKHTPGPWKIIGERDLLEDGIDDLMIVAFQVGPDAEDDDIYITNIGQGPVSPINESEHSKENLANARLIAAAPDLLEAAKKALDLIGNNESLAEAYKVLYWAIAKAEGGGS